MSDWTAVAPAAEIEPGGYRSVDLDGTAVAVFNLGGTFFAVRSRATRWCARAMARASAYAPALR